MQVLSGERMSGPQRISKIVDLEERQQVLNYLVRPDPVECRPVKILYFGHSFVQHMQDYMAALPYYMGNFGLPFNEASVYFKSMSGAPVERLRKKHNLNLVNRMQPEIVMLEIGTNDLSEPEKSPRYVHDQVLELVREILDCRVRKVVVNQVVRRGKKGLIGKDQDFEEKIHSYNHMMEDTLKHLPRTLFWHHRNMWGDIEALVEDGTHLNDQGNKRVYRSVKGALKSVSTEIRPAWRSREFYY